MPQPHSEQELIQAAVAGDSSAIGQLLFDHTAALERHLRPKIPADCQRNLGVDDVLQEVFAQVFRDIQTFDPGAEGTFLAWLKGIADHRLADALKHLRRKKRGGDRLHIAADPATSSSVAELVEVICQDGVTASRVMSRDEAERALLVAVAMLPDNLRTAIRARYFDGLPVEHIARQCGLTDGAVRGQIRRGQQKLAEIMGNSSHWLSSR